MLWLQALAFAAPPTDLLEQTLGDAMKAFSDQEAPPHYVAITVSDHEQLQFAASQGVISTTTHEDVRTLDVELRVGTPELDSTHELRGMSAFDGGGRNRRLIPKGDPRALQRMVWTELDRQYRDAAERIVLVRANKDVMVEEESIADDWEVRDGVVDHIETPDIDLDQEAWKQTLRDLSTILDGAPEVHNSQVALRVTRTERSLVSTDGTRLETGRLHARLTMILTTIAEDGDNVDVFLGKDVHDPASLPDKNTMEQWARDAVDRLQALREAPRGEPYSGPVILRGRAAGVFFHEVMGHRVEGHRQKRESEGKTFAEYVGKPILPEFIDVYDDPTLETLAGEDLNGYYIYDDEGTRAVRAPLVEDGKFQGFLMHRSPIPGFDHSNGHGRRSPGAPPLARMGNTIIETSKPQPFAELRKGLLAQIKEQGLEYGYIVEEIDGGFTTTGRVRPNAFNVRASASWRVYADGRPDELVRGIDLVGTPLVAFGNLIATSDEQEVFNGTCGAESGWVPVSAVAPSILFNKLEFQLKEKGQDRPPLLEKPMPADGATDAGGDQ